MIRDTGHMSHATCSGLLPRRGGAGDACLPRGVERVQKLEEPRSPTERLRSLLGSSTAQ